MASPSLPSGRHVLIVCTANVCRSPVAAALLERALRASSDEWTVRSAGTSPVRAALDPNTIAAAAAAGIPIDTHASRHLDRTIVQTDGADLVLTMTRAHLRDVIGVDPAAWPRTFTLKELARRASVVPPAEPGESLAAWLQRVAVDRQAVAMMKPDPADDVADPYGLARRAHDRMVVEVGDLVDSIVRLGPWRHHQGSGA